MFGILLSAGNALLGFIFRTVVIKACVIFAIFFVIESFAPVMKSLLPQTLGINELFSQLPESFYYYFNLFMIADGIKLVLSAMLSRFIIRRIPLIGG